MTHAELESGVRQALEDVDFDACGGLGIPYCVAVRDRMRELLPGAVLDCYHRLREVVVEARHGHAIAKIVVPIGPA